MAAIEVRNLSKTFGRVQALCEVAFSVAPGEMVALIGASGSGKSTLIRHIAGLIPGDPGCCDIRVLGAAMQADGRIDSHARRLRSQVGVIFQQFNLVDRLNVLTNVLLGRLGQMHPARGTLGLFTKAEKRLAMAALHRVGIPEVALQRASTLSGGQQQRAAIARTLVQEAQVVLADEPIASLDPASSKRVMEALAQINREDGRTILVSLHQVDYAIRYCPRAIALRQGRVAYDGPSSALTRNFLTELYGADSDDLVITGAAEPAAPRPLVAAQ